MLNTNPYIKDIESYLIKLAKKSPCERSRCASVIIINKIEIIGEGFNSAPHPCKTPLVCEKNDRHEKFKSDKTCCVHAEQRAIIDALERSPDDLCTSELYFLRIDGLGNPLHAGEPYCTICSKMACDVFIKTFNLYLQQGWTSYPTKLYNELSFNYGKTLAERI